MIRSTTRRTSLLLGAAGLALATSIALPAPAMAQAFNGSPTFVRGTGDVDRTTAGQDTITISSATAVIDWTLTEDQFGNALTFLPNGTTAYFQDSPGQGGFAVLNRILPSTNGNVVVFDGRVISRLANADQTFSSGGTVAFYSPTGILVGSNAVFDVGQLLLTTLDPNLDSFDSYAAGGTLQLVGAPGATSGITVAAGAQIGAPGEGSYFAAVAPQIDMGGTAYVNGTTAYVAGEQVNLTYNAGLFDIQIPVGTSVTSPIVHTGTTGGPSSTGAGDNHLIYAVARAQTDPITILLGGNLGFDAAVSAGVDNGDIILSARSDVFGRNANIFASDPVGGSISIDNASFTSSVLASASRELRVTTFDGAVSLADGLEAYANDSILLQASTGLDLTIDGDTYLQADGGVVGTESVGGTILLFAADGSTLSLNGNLTAFADATQQAGTTSRGGVIQVESFAGTIDIAGATGLYANASGAAQGANSDAFGGSIFISANDGGLTRFQGELVAQAVAFAAGSSGASAVGGDIEAMARSGGTLSVGDRVLFQALGYGADNAGTGDGGSGTGGTAMLGASGGTVTVGGNVFLRADGYGRAGLNGGNGGTGIGGESEIFADAGSVTIAGATDISATGFGGVGANGGAGIGGVALVGAEGTGAVQLAAVAVRAQGSAGNATSASGRGGDATGGFARIYTGDSGAINATGEARVQANATGGAGGSGGDATGGSAGIYAITGDIAVTGTAFVQATAIGGSATLGFGGTGGNALGGTAFIQADGSLTQSASLSIGGDAYIDAGGTGGSGGAGDGATIAAGAGGSGTGGTFQGEPDTGGAFALAGYDNATLTVGGFVSLSSRGLGGSGGAGGTGQSGGAGGLGTGGTAQAGTFSAGGDGSLLQGRAQFGSIYADASGRGGNGGSGDAGFGTGGDGVGGVAAVTANRATVQAGIMTTVANGNGGFGAVAGAGQGGTAFFRVTDTTLDAAELYAVASGIGGNATTGTGGDGTGGTAAIETSGTVTVAGVTNMLARGVGGASESGDGGIAQGGTIELAGLAGTLALGSLSLSADAVGGNGVTGGDAFGGTIALQMNAGTALSVTGGGLWSVDATGGAGNGADAGDALAGSVGILADGGSIVFGDLLRLNANGVGGDVVTGAALGGFGNGGEIAIDAVNGGTVQFGSLQAAASGLGGSGPTAQGGVGTGGTISLTADGSGSVIEILTDAGLRFSDVLNQGRMFVANGFGGSTTAGGSGIGGAGFGGSVSFAALTGGTIALPADPAAGAGADSFGFVGILARGIGGGSSVEGGRGGAGTSGLIDVLADGGTFTSGDMLASVFAQGGNSLSSALNIAGGNATGGVRNFTARNGGTMQVSMIGGGAGALGGNGSGTGVGGDAFGGTASLVVDNATATFVGRGLFFAGAQGGAGRIGGNATGGDVLIQLTNGATVNVVANADGVANIGLANPVFGGEGTERGGDARGDNVAIQITDSTLNAQLLVNATGTGGLASAGIGGNATGGSFLMTVDNSQVSLVTGSVFDVSAFGGAGITGGNALGGDAVLRAINGSTIDIYGDPDGASNLTLRSEGTGGTGSEGDGDGAGGGIDVTLLGAALTAPSLTLAANGISGSGAAQGGDVTLQVADTATADVGLLELEARAVNDGTADAIGGALQLVATGGTMQVDVLNADAFGATDGGDSVVVTDGGSILINDTANFDVAGDLTFVSANGGLFGGPSVSAPTASIAISSQGRVAFLGDNDNFIGFGGSQVFVESRQLDILAGARIGAELLALRVLGNDAVTVIGGDTETAGYTLTQAELARIDAGAAIFSASSGGLASSNIVIRDATIVGSLDDGTASVVIETDGVMRVEGTLAYVDAAATDQLLITSERLEIVTPGGIGMVDAQGNPAGIFTFAGRDFWMADAETIARLTENLTFDGRNDLLATAAAGSDDPLGYLRAGDVLLLLGDSLLVRNTGTMAEPGGITVTGSLTIAGGFTDFEDGAPPDRPLDVFAYGRRQNADGTFVTGAAFFDEVRFSTEDTGDGVVTTYTEGSQFNDCDITSGTCAAPPPDPTPPDPTPPDPDPQPEPPSEREVVLEEVQQQAPLAAATTTGTVAAAPVEQSEQDSDVEFGADFPGLVNASLAAPGNAIDDPVASGGDIALYGASDEDADEDEDEENGDAQ